MAPRHFAPPRSQCSEGIAGPLTTLGPLNSVQNGEGTAHMPHSMRQECHRAEASPLGSRFELCLLYPLNQLPLCCSRWPLF